MLGFREDHREKAPLCRWLIDGFTVDVMPDHENVLGFSNRWYPSARATATWHTIGEGTTHRIRVVDAPHFIATKLEAFRGRADGDFYHHDMEDLLAVVDGRAELLDELKASQESVRTFIAQEFQHLLEDDAFREAIPGHLPGDKASQARVPIVEERPTLAKRVAGDRPMLRSAGLHDHSIGLNVRACLASSAAARFPTGTSSSR